MCHRTLSSVSIGDILYYTCIILKLTPNTNNNDVCAYRDELLTNTQLLNRMRLLPHENFSSISMCDHKFDHQNKRIIELLNNTF